VIDSRPVDEGQSIRRRRVCENCNRRFTTYERIEETNRLMVVKKDGSRVPFDRNRILTGIQRACYKRSISAEQLGRVVDAIEEDISRKFQREVKSEYVGDRVMRHLKRMDKIAYVRFASVYHAFKDLGELLDEANALNANQDRAPGQQELFAEADGVPAAQTNGDGHKSDGRKKG
jgi:transcriptional repressor NrdR